VEHGNAMTRVGILGCGNIARILASRSAGFRIAAVFDRHPERVESIAAACGAIACHELHSFLQGDFDLVVEAASIGAIQRYTDEILRAGKDLIPLSVGAFADQGFTSNMVTLAGDLGRRIRIPSGALFGLDNVKIARHSHVDSLVLRTTKNPASLNLKTTGKKLLFQGSASQCIERFPRNVNVAVALSLAAGTDIQMELWVDPAIMRNTHEVLMTGEFGELDILVRNIPCPDNPATSYLAALSILTLLADWGQPLVVGT